MTVQNLIKIVRTVFEKFEIFIERSGEKGTIALVQKTLIKMVIETK